MPTYPDKRPETDCKTHWVTWNYSDGQITNENYLVPGECEKCGRTFELSFLAQGVWDTEAQSYLVEV